jgi:hypothetical protein
MLTAWEKAFIYPAAECIHMSVKAASLPIDEA